MAFKATLVARPETPTAAPYLGFPLTEIDLLQPNGECAVTPVETSPDSRDRIIEGVTGSDVAVDRRKLVELDLAIDYISAEKKGKIERLYHDGRPVLFCPNFGPETRWSVPFMRSEEDFAERASFTVSRGSNAHVWDATDQLMRTWTGTQAPISFNGHWNRYAGIYGSMTNGVADPHPTSTGHGWSNVTGTSVFTYTEDMLSPVVLQQTVTNEKGVLLVESPGGAVCQIAQSATGLSSSLPIGATLLIKTEGIVVLTLNTTGGALVLDTESITGDGTWQLVKLKYDNTTSETGVDLYLTQFQSATRDQISILSSVFIGNVSNENSFGDWSDGSNNGTRVWVSGTEFMLPAMNFSCLFNRRISTDQGLLTLTGVVDTIIVAWTSSDSIIVYDGGASIIETFASVGTTFGIGDGDWCHVVIQASHNGGWELFVNGVAHADNGNSPWNAESFTEANIGRALTLGSFPPNDAHMGGGGISHTRLDGRVWSAVEITDHYNTYFSPRGRGIVEPMFGKTLRIEEFSMTPRGVDNPMQWVGSLLLRELGPDTDFAPMIRQEGDL